MKGLLKTAALACVRGLADMRRDVALRVKIGKIAAGLSSCPGVGFVAPSATPGAQEPWRRAYAAATGVDSPHYVPEPLFYNAIEPHLNDVDRVGFYLDKNTLDRLRFDWTLPRTLGRIMRGRFLGPDYGPADPETAFGDGPVVVKPSAYRASGGGKGVRLLPAEEAVAFVRAECARRRPIDHIFQAPLDQSPDMARFAPSSVNTLRIMTLLDAQGPREVSSLLRMGVGGSFVDNLGSGGIACGVRDGRLAATAFDKGFRGRSSHPETGVVFEGAPVPGWSAALALVLRLQAALPEIALISWDVAIDAAGRPVVIEFNARFQEINAHQLANGPLFGASLAQLARAARPRRLFGFVTR